MAVQEGYSPRNRAERVISAGRLFLALFLSIALVLEPTEVPASATVYSLTLAGYFIIALCLTAIMRFIERKLRRGPAFPRSAHS